MPTLRPEYLVAKALVVGRAKDRARIAAFLDENAVDFEKLADVLDRHRLREAWRRHCAMTAIAERRIIELKP